MEILGERIWTKLLVNNTAVTVLNGERPQMIRLFFGWLSFLFFLSWVSVLALPMTGRNRHGSDSGLGMRWRKSGQCSCCLVRASGLLPFRHVYFLYKMQDITEEGARGERSHQRNESRLQVMYSLLRWMSPQENASAQ